MGFKLHLRGICAREAGPAPFPGHRRAGAGWQLGRGPPLRWLELLEQQHPGSWKSKFGCFSPDQENQKLRVRLSNLFFPPGDSNA